MIPAELVAWARTAKVPEFAEVLHRCDLHTVAEVAALHDTDIESLFVAENVMPGSRARFRLAITGLRMAKGGTVHMQRLERLAIIEDTPPKLNIDGFCERNVGSTKVKTSSYSSVSEIKTGTWASCA